MRNAIYAAFLLTCASTAAIAQTQQQQRPIEAAPTATAPIEERDDWCRRYAAHVAEQASHPTARPSDVRPTHLVETEINYCKMDPQEYQRETVAELSNRRDEISPS